LTEIFLILIKYQVPPNGTYTSVGITVSTFAEKKLNSVQVP